MRAWHNFSHSLFQIVKPDGPSDLLKVYFTKPVARTKFPQETLGIDPFPIPMHCSTHAIEWKQNSHVTLSELHGNERTWNVIGTCQYFIVWTRKSLLSRLNYFIPQKINCQKLFLNMFKSRVLIKNRKYDLNSGGKCKHH